MNEFVLAGIGIFGLVAYAMVSIYIAVRLEDVLDQSALGLLMLHALLTIGSGLLIIGGVPYVIMIWLITYGALLAWAIYLDIWGN